MSQVINLNESAKLSNNTLKANSTVKNFNKMVTMCCCDKMKMLSKVQNKPSNSRK